MALSQSYGNKTKRNIINLPIPDSSELANGARFDYFLDPITNQPLYENYDHADLDAGNNSEMSITWTKPKLVLSNDFFNTIDNKPETYKLIRLPTITVVQFETSKNCLTIVTHIHIVALLLVTCNFFSMFLFPLSDETSANDLKIGQCDPFIIRCDRQLEFEYPRMRPRNKTKQKLQPPAFT